MSKALRLVLLVPALLWLVVIGPASQAATTSSFTMSTVMGGSPKGQAKATIKVTWTNARTVSVSGTLTDLCPADGAGAYLWLEGVTSASINNKIGPISLAADKDGCGNGSVSFSRAVPNPGSTIRTVVLILEERDGSGVCSNTGCDTRVTKANPYA